MDDVQIPQADALFAMVQDMRQFVEKREPHGLALFKTIVQHDHRHVLVPSVHSVNRGGLEILDKQDPDAYCAAKFSKARHAFVNDLGEGNTERDLQLCLLVIAVPSLRGGNRKVPEQGRQAVFVPIQPTAGRKFDGERLLPLTLHTCSFFHSIQQNE